MEGTPYLEYQGVIERNLTEQTNSSLVFSRITRAPAHHQHYVISLFLSCLYTIVLFPVGFVGNILIIVVNLGHKGRMTAPDLYFVNLAVADLALVADSLIEVFNLKEGYYERAALCTFMALFQQVNMYSSIFFLTWMSYDRYQALVGAVGRRAPNARLSCCLIWTCSSLLTLGPFAVAQVQHAGELHFCFANVSQVQWLEVMLGFLLPLCVLGLCYWRIARVLVRSRAGAAGEGLPRRRRRQRKALRMIFAAVLVFFVCWLPENVFVSVRLLRGEAEGSTLWQDHPLTAHVVSLAAFSNSCLNPLIYSFLGVTFRDKLRLFCRHSVSWTKLQRSTSGNSERLPAAGACSRATWPSPELLLNSCCPPQTHKHTPGPDVLKPLHHKHALPS